MRIVCLSDTHWTKPPYLPHGDIIIHAGDGTEWPGFMEWVARNDVLAISGNHDIGVTFPLNDAEIEVRGLLVYGMPWTPKYGNWDYMLPRNGDELRAKVEAIPSGLDILVTHGPPYGTLDTWHAGQSGINIGCELLAAHLESMSKPPRLHVFGHIHMGYGVRDHRHYNGCPQCVSVNAALCNESNKLVNAPIVIDL